MGSDLKDTEFLSKRNKKSYSYYTLQTFMANMSGQFSKKNLKRQHNDKAFQKIKIWLSKCSNFDNRFMTKFLKKNNSFKPTTTTIATDTLSY